MDTSKITFGDKIFLYGHFLEHLDEFPDREYNTVIGYMTVGGFLVKPIPTDILAACIPGFIAELNVSPELTVATPFNNVEMVDVTNKLAFSPPLLHGCKVWMPTTTLL